MRLQRLAERAPALARMLAEHKVGERSLQKLRWAQATVGRETPGRTRPTPSASRGTTPDRCGSKTGSRASVQVYLGSEQAPFAGLTAIMPQLTSAG